MNLAVDLAFRFSLTIYDAVYAALAQNTGIPLITADYKCSQKLKMLPFIEELRELDILN